ncbi:MAG: 4-hydroxythreonine-4-phosphate dehydrogenase PdxA [Bacteroidota bacterium]
MRKPIIGISTGDPNGIGPEVILKSLRHEGVTKLLTPVIYAPAKLLSAYRKSISSDLRFKVVGGVEDIAEGQVNVIEYDGEVPDLELGQATSGGGQAATRSLTTAALDLKAAHLDALVTAPINKANMPKEDFPFPGHTEFLTTQLEADESLMFLVSDTLRVGLVTNHVPVAEIAGKVNKDLILKKLAIMEKSLRRDFGIEKPNIAVLALNPHAGDNGVIGTEDDKVIRPAIVEAKKKGMLVMGPYPADGFFGSGKHLKFDAVLAMYHDQGLIPFKALSFGQGVNFTAGLPAISTSPDHGTAYDIAGQNVADPTSFRRALFLAQEAVINRRNYDEDTANPLVPRPPKPKKKPAQQQKNQSAGKNQRGKGKNKKSTNKEQPTPKEAKQE